MGNLFQELKRRNVFKVGAAYAIVGWVLAQIAAFAVDTFDAPQWVQQIFVVFLILGFPITLIMAWAYDVTPSGIKSDAASQSKQAIAQPADQKLIYAILGLLVLLGGFQIAERFVLNSPNDSISVSNATNSGSNLQPNNSRVVRSIIPLGEQTLMGGLRTLVKLSVDGTRLAYVSFNDEQSQLYLRDLNSLESQPIGPVLRQGPSVFDFSPNGEMLAFTNQFELMTISLANGRSQSLDVRVGPAIDWADDNAIYYTSIGDFGISRVSNSGEPLPSLEIPRTTEELEVFANPEKLPATDVVMFTRMEIVAGAERTGNIELFNMESGVNRRLIDNAYSASYSNTGHIVFFRERNLWAVPFDLENMRLTGDQVLLVEAIEGNHADGMVAYSLSASGSLVYLPSDSVDSEFSNPFAQYKVLTSFDRAGQETPLAFSPQDAIAPKLSPDGTRVAMLISRDVWVYDLERGVLSQLTFSGFVPGYAVWQLDGERLIYADLAGIHSINANGIGNVETLLNRDVGSSGLFAVSPTGFTPDGRQLLYQTGNGTGPNSNWDLNSLDISPEQSTRALIESENRELDATVSPNGRFMGYSSNVGGTSQIYVRPYPEINGDRWQVSTDRGSEPVWSNDGAEIFYKRVVEGRTEFYSVAVSTDAEFSVGIPELMFTLDYTLGSFASYSVSSDGQRFFVLKPAEDELEIVPIETNLVLVENFAEELRQLVPVIIQ